MIAYDNNAIKKLDLYLELNKCTKLSDLPLLIDSISSGIFSYILDRSYTAVQSEVAWFLS